MMRAIVILAALIGTPAIAADQFDLVCASKASTTRYRVDLARGETCSGSCESIWKLGAVTAGEIRLIDKAAAYRGDLEERSIVNRLTGEWHYDMSLSGRSDGRSGKCDVAPFSGFPVAKF